MLELPQVVEVAIVDDCSSDRTEEGKKIGFSDGLTAVWLVFRFNLFYSRRRAFRQEPELNRAIAPG